MNELQVSQKQLDDIERRYQFLLNYEQYLEALRAKKTSEAYKEARIIGYAVCLINELQSYLPKCEQTSGALDDVTDQLIDALHSIVEDGAQ